MKINTKEFLHILHSITKFIPSTPVIEGYGYLLFEPSDNILKICHIRENITTRAQIDVEDSSQSESFTLPGKVLLSIIDNLKNEPSINLNIVKEKAVITVEGKKLKYELALGKYNIMSEIMPLELRFNPECEVLEDTFTIEGKELKDILESLTFALPEKGGIYYRGICMDWNGGESRYIKFHTTNGAEMGMINYESGRLQGKGNVVICSELINPLINVMGSSEWEYVVCCKQGLLQFYPHGDHIRITTKVPERKSYDIDGLYKDVTSNQNYTWFAVKPEAFKSAIERACIYINKYTSGVVMDVVDNALWIKQMDGCQVGTFLEEMPIHVINQSTSHQVTLNPSLVSNAIKGFKEPHIKIGLCNGKPLSLSSGYWHHLVMVMR